jgi:EAL domain-containing protein (putative c-di-GMP-specific phosphodiesterase class I)
MPINAKYFKRNDNALALLTSLISLGKSVDCKIVTEGVKTKQQAKHVADCHTDQLQGYLFNKSLLTISVE